jgi:hypothetical protein
MPKITNPRRTEASLPAFDERLRYRVEIAAKFLDQSRATTWKQIRDGQLRVIREGQRVFIPGTEIVRRSTIDCAL